MFENILQPTHLILVLGIAMIFFGPKKLPELGRGLGESIRGFRDAMRQDPGAPKDEKKDS
ncbi:MAG TPA: twin-arginine translocase TatA/TatE family subunit [Thermoanaerobaculia bacterium]